MLLLGIVHEIRVRDGQESLLVAAGRQANRIRQKIVGAIRESNASSRSVSPSHYMLFTFVARRANVLYVYGGIWRELVAICGSHDDLAISVALTDRCSLQDSVVSPFDRTLLGRHMDGQGRHG